MVNFTRQVESDAKQEDGNALTEEELRAVLQRLGLQEGSTGYHVTKSREGDVQIQVEEEETDDPTAKDQIILDYSKTIDRAVVVDGEEQSDES